MCHETGDYAEQNNQYRNAHGGLSAMLAAQLKASGEQMSTYIDGEI